MTGPLHVRVRHKLAGSHVHMQVFAGFGPWESCFGKAGELVLRVEEFEAWKNRNELIRFVDETTKEVHPK